MIRYGPTFSPTLKDIYLLQRPNWHDYNPSHLANHLEVFSLMKSEAKKDFQMVSGCLRKNYIKYIKYGGWNAG